MIEGKDLAETVEPTDAVEQHLLLECYRFRATGGSQVCQRTVVGLFCAYNRSLLPYDRPLLTLMRTSGMSAYSGSRLSMR